MKKIVFCDLDGTLVEKNELIEKDIIKQIQEFQKENIFVINTGRNFDEASMLIEKVGIPFDFMILNNGAHIIDGNCFDLMKNVIDKKTGLAVIEMILGYDNLEATFNNGEGTYTLKHGVTHVLKDGEFIAIDADFLETAKGAKSFDIINCNQYDRNLETVYEVISKLEQFEVSPNLNDIYLDISSKGATKGNGARTLMELLDFKGISYGIGDSYNDLSMFEIVDHPATFHHCLDSIKEKAEYLVATVSELLKKVEY